MCEQELEHLTFKGVPIDGTIDEFVEKLKAFGFCAIFPGNSHYADDFFGKNRKEKTNSRYIT